MALKDWKKRCDKGCPSISKLAETFEVHVGTVRKYLDGSRKLPDELREKLVGLDQTQRAREYLDAWIQGTISEFEPGADPPGNEEAPKSSEQAGQQTQEKTKLDREIRPKPLDFPPSSRRPCSSEEAGLWRLSAEFSEVSKSQYPWDLPKEKSRNLRKIQEQLQGIVSDIEAKTTEAKGDKNRSEKLLAESREALEKPSEGIAADERLQSFAESCIRRILEAAESLQHYAQIFPEAQALLAAVENERHLLSQTRKELINQSFASLDSQTEQCRVSGNG